MNITIIQDSSRQELLGASGADIIEKLYQIAIDFNNTLTLEGNIISTNAYGYQVDYLNTNYGPNFIVNATNRYIHFEDPNMESYLASMGIGTDGKVTEAQAAAVTVIANASNSTITKFNELKYFTNITSSKGGWTGTSSGYMRFKEWTALQEIDISNLTSIGHKNSYGYEDTFYGCSSLKKVKASDKLKQIGFYAFGNCTNLEEITGLEGTIELSSNAFIRCSMLTDESFENVQFKLPQSSPDELCFFKCILLQNITLDPNTTYIPSKTFKECSSLKNVYGLDNINEIWDESFYGCSNLENLSRLSGEVIVHKGVFNGCSKLKSDSLENVQFYINKPLADTSSNWERTFYNCSELTNINISDKTLVIPYCCFQNCSKLESVSGLQNVQLVDRYAFSGCTNLQNIDLAGDVTVKTGEIFNGCSSLTTIPVNSITRTREGDIGKTFKDCRNLQRIGKGTDNVDINFTYLGELEFYNCLNLTGTLNFPTCVQISTSNSGGAIVDCPKIEKISLPAVTTITGGSNWDQNYRNTFAGCTNLKVVDIGQNITSLSNRMFYNNPLMQAFIIRATTPPTIGDGTTAYAVSVMGNNTVNVYVPDEALSTYQNTIPYSGWGNQLKPLSQFDESQIQYDYLQQTTEP